MELLTNDMLAAIDDVDLSDADKEKIKTILYQERQNKELSWDKDAERYIARLIDGNQNDSVGANQ
jgi:hypothetical protein